MPKDNQADPRNFFAVRFLPWLLGAAMLGVYWFTLNRWLTLLNLFPVSQISGFNWQPQLSGPLQWLVTLPFRWLPAAQVPAALNFFSAACAALVLALLARCVAILPQDRTEPQRQREKSDFSFLTGWPAFFPPLFAVLLGGLQLVFWEHATSYTGEMVDLLLFAVIVWLLLEYRLDEKEWRLTAVAVAYGAGVAESWMFVGFFPVMLAAVIWIKKLEFFNVRFLARLLLCGLAGMSLLLLLPLLGKFSGEVKAGVWDLLRPAISTDWHVVKSIELGVVRATLVQASLSALVPLLLMSIRWNSSYGDNSRLGTALATNMFHLMHAAMFTVCVWVMFDSPFSPHQLAYNFPVQELYGTSFLTFDFLAALGAGYCCGYFLTVFGKPPQPTRRDPRPRPIFPPALMWLCPVLVTGVFVCAAVSVFTLVYKNKPVIQEANNGTLLKFAKFTTENLPAAGAIVLCDSDRPGQEVPMRAMLVQAALAREGRTRDFPVLDTLSLNWSPYHQFIHRRYPGKIPLVVKTNTASAVPPLAIFAMLDSLSKSNTLCYLHPSYGYYFEQFYEEPHGLVYTMKKLPEDTLLPPPPDKNLIAANEAFWDRVVAGLAPAITNALAAPSPSDWKNIPDWLLMHLHAAPEANQNAILAGIFCARSLDDWGVELQRAGELQKAAVRFREARQFNPDNVVADINLAFNETLQAGAPLEVNPDKVTSDQFGKYRNWNEMVTANGPVDDISFDFMAGYQFMNDAFFRQAAYCFERVRQLVPRNFPARLLLAQIYLLNHLPDRAFAVLQDPLSKPGMFGLTADNSAGLDLLAAAAHFQKNETADGVRLLDDQVARHPDDDTLLATITQAYFARGLYTNALRVIDRKLARTPDDPTWLFGRGYACIQMGDYENSIKAMTRVLEIQTNDPSARFNRALAYFKTEKLDEARADYAAIQAEHTNSFQVAFGLGEIAWRKKENAEALRNYQIYLANAPTNTPEFTAVRSRVAQLDGK